MEVLPLVDDPFVAVVADADQAVPGEGRVSTDPGEHGVLGEGPVLLVERDVVERSSDEHREEGVDEPSSASLHRSPLGNGPCSAPRLSKERSAGQRRRARPRRAERSPGSGTPSQKRAPAYTAP